MLKRRANHRKLWKAVAWSKDPRCQYCNVPTTLERTDKPDRLATVDHFIPLAHSGRDAPDNYRLACQKCNKAKGNKSPSSRARMRANVEVACFYPPDDLIEEIIVTNAAQYPRYAKFLDELKAFYLVALNPELKLL